MTQERDLLRTIAREPDDDAPRLVYADWLDDAGQHDRAEFIRGQVRLAEIQRAFPPPDRDTLEAIFYCTATTRLSIGDSPERRRVAYGNRLLLDAYEEQWLRSLPGVGKGERVWSRGFVEAVDATPTTLQAQGEELFDLAPIRHLMLNGLAGTVDILKHIPEENCLRALDLFASNLNLATIRTLPGYLSLDRLEELSLMFNRLDDRSIDFLCEHPFFQRLRLLRLACNPLTSEGRERLRGHFGNRVCFDRVRHRDRLLTFRTVAEQGVWAGLGRDFVQVLILEVLQCTTLAEFDHAGDLLTFESRYDGGKSRNAWMAAIEYRPATIKVKRLSGVYDFPVGHAGTCDQPEAEPEEYADARDFINRWLAAGRYRLGGCCGGWWYDGKTGERVGEV